MVNAGKTAVCVDSSIFLAEVFGNEVQSSRSGAIDKFQNLFSFEKCMSETVKSEIEKRINAVTLFIGQVSKGFTEEFRVFKAEKAIIELSDLSFVESFFSAQKKEYPVRSTEHEILENVESALAVLLVSYRDGISQGIDDFVLDAMQEFDKILTRIKYNFDTKLSRYFVFHDPVNPSTCKKLQGEPKLEKTVRKKPQDIRILCEVEAYQSNSGKTCLLATTDHADFLDNKSTIESLIGIKCIDPIYLPNELTTK